MNLKKHLVNQFLVVLVMVCLYIIPASAQPSLAGRYPIIPQPYKLIVEKGTFFINQNTKVVLKYLPYRKESAKLINLVKQVGGFALSYGKAGNNSIIISKDLGIQSKEGYHLTITPNKVILSASDPAGIFYGVETIRQLLPVAISKERAPKTLSLPAVEINDHPVFAWRGMMLDVARHFFSVTYVKKFIDRMALYKLNRLHLHLMDDQGWRIQVEKYPELTRKGAWRTFDRIDSECIKLSKENPDFKLDPQHIIHRNGRTLYGGYYTQVQMRDIIRYAAARHIQIIPEIDMPGHMMTAIKIFPYLSCTGQPGHGKIFSVPLCPCKESTFIFADNVYQEVFSLFPSKYIHIGGDEVDKSTWVESPECEALMKDKRIKSVNQLQSYFISRMHKLFEAHGKTLIGWDDLLEGGIDSSAVIMYWRTWMPKELKEAAKNGNKIIMSPDGPLYFSAWPNMSPLSTVYHYDPIPLSLRGTPDASNIIGIQANLWTERVPSEKRADYLTMPRMTALAEAAWTDDPNDYHSYLQRLKYKYPRWDKMHIYYRIPDLKGFTENNVFTDSTTLAVQKPLTDLVVRYTSNGTVPTSSSPVLPPSLTIKRPDTIQLAAFTPEGNRGDLYTIKYQKESYMAPLHLKDTTEGLRCIYYKGPFKNTNQMVTMSPVHTFIVKNIRIPESIKAPAFGLQYKGYISIPQTGVYSFYLNSDDGSVLRIGNQILINNDGLHGAHERSGQIALQKGLHSFSLDYIQAGGGATLQLQYSKYGSSPEQIPDILFKHEVK